MPNHVFAEPEHELTFTTQGSTSFHYSFGFLPREERDAIRTVYAFARRIDDIVDDTPSIDAQVIQQKVQRLQWWRAHIESLYEPASDSSPSVSSLGSVIKRFSIPKQHFLTIIDGCERDLYQRRYQTFAELKEYCYSVASAVGLISIEIFGYRHEDTRQYAIHLGYALQLTNILRDVRSDKERGYIYIPLEDLERFRLSEQDIINEIYDERFVDLMSFQAKRAREYYHQARALLRADEKLTMVAAEIMDAIYYRLLDKIELNNYNVYQERIKVNTVHKLITAARIWLGSKLFVKRLR